MSEPLLARRKVLIGLASSTGLLLPGISVAKIDKLLNAEYGTATIVHEHTALKVPALAENGNSVPMSVSYEGSEGVKNIKVFAPSNPEPLLVEFIFDGRQPSVQMSTRIRLADSQTLMAVVQTTSGTLYAATAETVITLAACIEPLL